MENKPSHYDGSVQTGAGQGENQAAAEPFEITDEMRKNISGNPYFTESN